MSPLKDKVAIITGAGKGIGRSTSLALAKEGVSVICTSRTQADLESLVKEIKSFGGKALPIVGDVKDEEKVNQIVYKGIHEYGRIDILVNNAGVGILGPLDSLSVEDYDNTMDTHMKGTFLFSRAVLPFMKKQGSGNIINISSISGLKGFSNASIYCASKFAIVGFTRSLDLDLRQSNIKVSVICPAGVDTEWAIGTGLRKEDVAQLDRLKPETVANAILFVINQPENSRVTELIVYPMCEQGAL